VYWWGRHSCLPFDRLTAWFDRLSAPAEQETTTLSRSTLLTALSFYRMSNVEGLSLSKGNVLTALSEVEGPIVARQPVESLWVERECLAHQGPVLGSAGTSYIFSGWRSY